MQQLHKIIKKLRSKIRDEKTNDDPFSPSVCYRFRLEKEVYLDEFLKENLTCERMKLDK